MWGVGERLEQKGCPGGAVVHGYRGLGPWCPWLLKSPPVLWIGDPGVPLLQSQGLEFPVKALGRLLERGLLPGSLLLPSGPLQPRTETQVTGGARKTPPPSSAQVLTQLSGAFAEGIGRWGLAPPPHPTARKILGPMSPPVCATGTFTRLARAPRRCWLSSQTDKREPFHKLSAFLQGCCDKSREDTGEGQSCGSNAEVYVL